MVKELEMGFFFASLQFSIYNVNVVKVHRRLPATWSEKRVHQDRTDELVEYDE